MNRNDLTISREQRLAEIKATIGRKADGREITPTPEEYRVGFANELANPPVNHPFIVREGDAIRIRATGNDQSLAGKLEYLGINAAGAGIMDNDVVLPPAIVARLRSIVEVYLKKTDTAPTFTVAKQTHEHILAESEAHARELATLIIEKAGSDVTIIKTEDGPAVRYRIAEDLWPELPLLYKKAKDIAALAPDKQEPAPFSHCNRFITPVKQDRSR